MNFIPALGIRLRIAKSCTTWHGIFKGLSQDGGRADFSEINRKHGLLFLIFSMQVTCVFVCFGLFRTVYNTPPPSCAPPIPLHSEPPPPPLPPFVYKRRLVVFLLSECLSHSFSPCSLSPFTPLPWWGKSACVAYLQASRQSWVRIFKRFWSPGIDSKGWIPAAYVDCRAGTKTLFLLGS